MIQIVKRLVWPIAAFSLAFVAFAQMFYTLLQTRCALDENPTTDCAVHDAYRIVYILWRGESPGGYQSTPEYLSQEKILIVLFLTTIYLFALGMFVLVIVIATKWDWPNCALTTFWETKLAFVLSLCEIGLRSKPSSDDNSAMYTLNDILRRKWTVLFATAMMEKPYTDDLWYAKRDPSVCSSLYAWVTMVFWLALGLFTFGILWPPQVREAMFRHWTQSSGDTVSNPRDHVSTQLVNMRNELSQLKAMSYERYGEVEKQIRDFRDIFLFALTED
jgi:hypothetical protein